MWLLEEIRSWIHQLTISSSKYLALSNFLVSVPPYSLPWNFPNLLSCLRDRWHWRIHCFFLPVLETLSPSPVIWAIRLLPVPGIRDLWLSQGLVWSGICPWSAALDRTLLCEHCTCLNCLSTESISVDRNKNPAAQGSSQTCLSGYCPPGWRRTSWWRPGSSRRHVQRSPDGSPGWWALLICPVVGGGHWPALLPQRTSADKAKLALCLFGHLFGIPPFSRTEAS